MISGQLSKLTGVPVHGEGFVAEVSSFAAHIGLVDWATVALGVVALVFLFVVSWRWPGPRCHCWRCCWARRRCGSGICSSTASRWSASPPAAGSRMAGDPDLMLLALPAVGVLLVGYTDLS